MDDIANQTLLVLKNIQAELVKTNERLDGLTARVDVLNECVETGFAAVNQRVDALTERVESGFADVNHRLDGVLAISGSHHTELESRVRRIEDHLGLSTG